VGTHDLSNSASHNKRNEIETAIVYRGEKKERQRVMRKQGEEEREDKRKKEKGFFLTCDFHGPSIDVANIAPSSALTRNRGREGRGERRKKNNTTEGSSNKQRWQREEITTKQTDEPYKLQ
jgi:hypothetical protein